MSGPIFEPLYETNTTQVRAIPVRNVWLLMLYASDLFRQFDSFNRVSLEDDPDNLPDLMAEILCKTVELRLTRNLSYGFQMESANRARVRGKIDLLKTERHQLAARGLVCCRFEDLVVDTARNRLVKAALSSLARMVQGAGLSRRCNALSSQLRRLGVSEKAPARAKLILERLGLRDKEDRFMVAAAILALQMAFPTQGEGTFPLFAPAQDVIWLRQLYEKAIGGFYDVVLSPSEWHVSAGKPLNWRIEQKTDGIDAILPSMKTDIVLDSVATSRRVVIDTKFTSILTRGWYREESLKSGYIYQIYAYLRSQEGSADSRSAHSEGLLLHPSVGAEVDETVVIQGHAIRFATVDLSASSASIRGKLLKLVQRPAQADVARIQTELTPAN
jgi:5-methylcytosine-specific restriction enzyme subunit McrC